MPPLLRKSTIRLFEASMASLNLALTGISLPQRFEPRDPESLYAAEVGLIGAAAEQGVNACVTQIYGLNGILLPDGKFKSATQIFDEFVGILKSPIPRSAFLVQGIADSAQHIQLLLNKTVKFKLLAKSRAGGLHAGIGPSREVALSLAQDVSDFLSLLSLSSRIRPYLLGIPKPYDIVKDRAAVIEDLIQKASSSRYIHEKSVYIKSAFLIIPDMPDEMPSWIESFERIHIAPTAEDIVLLLDALNKAVPSSLIRATGGGAALPIRVEATNPNAIPVQPQFLRREFNQINEQWHADVGNANGRIKSNILDIPPEDFVLDIFGLGLENLNVLPEASVFPAQQTWPFVTTSLNTAGAILPYWFLVRKTENHKELIALMKRVEKLSKGHLKRNVEEFFEGMNSITKETSLKRDSALSRTMQKMIEDTERSWESLKSVLEKGLHYSEDIEVIIESVINEEIDVGAGMIRICALESITSKQRVYWIRKLAECCSHEEEIPGLLQAFKVEELASVKSTIRKQLRLIDFLSYGPMLTS